MLEITEKAKKYGVLSALLFDLKNTFKSVDKELNSFLEKLNIVYNTEKELFCLEVNDNANVQTYTVDLEEELEFSDEILDTSEYYQLYDKMIELFNKTSKTHRLIDYTEDTSIVCETGEWVYDYKVLGLKDTCYVYLDGLSSYNNLMENSLVFDGRVYAFEAIDDELERFIDSLDDDEKELFDKCLHSAYEDQLEWLWNKDYDDFASIYANINSFLEENNLKDIFILAYKGKKFFIQREVKEIHNPNVICYSNYEFTYLERIKERSNSLDKVYDYLVSLKEDFLINVREMAKEQFEERRIELQNSIDKDIRHSTVEQDVQENINTKRHRI